MILNINNRFQAFAVHLLVSSLLFAAFLCLMLIWWYPPPYFEIEGGGNVLTILIGVDIILGPLLTLVIFKQNKPGLKFDLSLIAAIQLTALAYGGIIIYQERPIFVVFAIDRFTLVSTQDIDIQQLAEVSLTEGSHRGPIPVFAKLPENIEENNNLILGVISGEKDLEFRAEYYELFIPHLKKALSRSLELENLYKGTNQNIINQFLEKHNRKEADLAFFPIIGKNKDMLLTVHRKTGRIVGAIDINPWLN